MSSHGKSLGDLHVIPASSRLFPGRHQHQHRPSPPSPPQSRLPTLIAEGAPAPRPLARRLASRSLYGAARAAWITTAVLLYQASLSDSPVFLTSQPGSFRVQTLQDRPGPSRTVQESGSTVPETCLRLIPLVRLFPATMSSRMISATCLFAPGDPAARARLLSGCRWDGAVPRVPPASVWDRRPAKDSALRGYWHMPPFRSILLLPKTCYQIARLICEGTATSPEIGWHDFWK